MQNPRVQFNIPQSTIASPIDVSSSTIQSTPPTASQPSTSNIPSDYLNSIPTSEQIRENPFNPPATTEHLPYWMTQVFTQKEPNFVIDQIDVSSDTTLSLPEILSLPSTPSLSQFPPAPFPLNFPTNLDARYRENSFNNIPLRLDWKTFVAPLHYLVKTLKAADYTTVHQANYNTETISTKTYKNKYYNRIT